MVHPFSMQQCNNRITTTNDLEEEEEDLFAK